MVDVAMVTYRSWPHTESCLEHLRKQTVEHRVFACDNGCDQGTALRLAERYPEVTVLHLDVNGPYAVALNAAVAAGQSDLVVMINNDVDAPPDFLERITAPFAASSRLGSVAAVLLRPGGQQIDSAGLTTDRTLSGFPRLKGQPPTEVQGQDPVLTGPDGAAAAFRRVAWEQLGGLEESLFGYMDDFDLALRMRVSGWQTTLATDAVAIHVGSATYGHRSPEQRRKAGLGRAYLLRRYGVLRSPIAPRTLLAEAVVVVGDFLLSRDGAALAGRVAGWRAAAGLPRRPWPPREAIDEAIGFMDSMRLRRGVYMRAPTTAPAATINAQSGGESFQP